MSKISEISLEFKERGGKRLRPRLCRAVFEACGGRGDIGPVCDAIECFHKASLIHDDIQDGDECRYGRPTVWKEHGVAVAIAAGDWLVAHGYQLIAKSAFPQRAEMLATVVDSHVGLCEGQGDDLLGLGNCAQTTVEQYLSTCARKTGEAFALAAALGALAAGADAAPYRAYGLAYGILFQINDDLADGGDEDRLLPLKRDYEARLAKLKPCPQSRR
ncbi:MAG: polyprenyl synthetase family protein [Kiritimatiellia bacterium]